MEITSSADLFKGLWSLDLLHGLPKFWWPNPFSMECVVGVVLTQNTKWSNVEKSLNNLRQIGLFYNDDETLRMLACMQDEILASHITSSGFFNQKARRLISLSHTILQDFSDFNGFVKNVDRNWLLAQKGIGYESADSILNYACGHEVMVVDKYTHRLMSSLGFEFFDYMDLQDFCQRGIRECESELLALSGAQNLAHLFMLFHGLIVEFSKRKIQLPIRS